MPRDGDGSSDNGPLDKVGKDIIHGVDTPEGDKTSKADKAAPMPEGLQEKGGALEGMNASGGGSQGIKQGKDVGQGSA